LSAWALRASPQCSAPSWPTAGSCGGAALLSASFTAPNARRAARRSARWRARQKPHDSGRAGPCDSREAPDAIHVSVPSRAAQSISASCLSVMSYL
jgi:hypothetical protein